MGVVGVHGLVYVEHVLVGHVVVLPHRLVVQELSPDLRVQLLDVRVQVLLLLRHLLHPRPHLRNLTLHFRVFVPPDPPYRVFLDFLDVVYALEHVRDVVYASFLYLQLLNRNVEVDCCVLAAFDEVYKLFGEHR